MKLRKTHIAVTINDVDLELVENVLKILGFKIIYNRSQERKEWGRFLQSSPVSLFVTINKEIREVTIEVYWDGALTI